MSWTLKTATTESALADWGLAAGTVRRQNQAADSASFSASALAFDADPIFAVGDVLELWRDRAADFTGGTRVFVGEVVSVPVFASGAAEGQSYELRNAWSGLDEILYEQLWYLADPDTLELAPSGRQSHVVLFQGVNGSKLTLGQQLADIVTVATEAGLSLQASAGDLALLTLQPPYDEARDLTCAEALRKCLRWIPDAVTWFDYTTTPPTLRIQRRATLATVTLPCVTTDDYLVEAVELRARPDLVAPAVVLKYERVNSVDGVPWRQLVKDVFPVDADEGQRGNLIATIDLEGDAVQKSSAAIVTRPFRPDLASWWALRDGEITDATSVTMVGWSGLFEDGSPLTDAEAEFRGLVNELVSGQIAPWMLGAAGAAETVRVMANCDYETEPTLTAGQPQKVQGKALRTRVTVTSLASGTFTTSDLVSQGEDVPVGLAEQLYAAVSVLHYEGRIGCVAQECPAVGFGRLNLTGGRAAWATMGALIQGIDYQIETGQTMVTFGPPAHLGATDLIELLRFNRQRRISVAFGSRSSGRDERQQAGGLGSLTANHDTASPHSTAVADFLWLRSADDSGRSIFAPASGLVHPDDGPVGTGAGWVDATVKIGGVDAVVRMLAQRVT